MASAERRTAAKSLPLEGKVPNGCEADEVGHESRCNVMAERKANVPVTAITWPQREDATSSVAIATASPQGEANGLGRTPYRRKKAFPLRGRCRTDVRRMRWGANQAATLWQSERPTCPSLP